MTPARAHFAAALAKMRGAEGLLSPPLTAHKRDLLIQRLGDAIEEAVEAFSALQAAAPEDEPLGRCAATVDRRSAPAATSPVSRGRSADDLLPRAAGEGDPEGVEGALARVSSVVQFRRPRA